jgi:hypothetical protein
MQQEQKQLPLYITTTEVHTCRHDVSPHERSFAKSNNHIIASKEKIIIWMVDMVARQQDANNKKTPNCGRATDEK